ncbi:MAG: GNAT family N-acetyltransferase [Streptosporangiales bacterium]|nr:GNAT family N-acetyltransferase [Streptosporangiales bacterium]
MNDADALADRVAAACLADAAAAATGAPGRRTALVQGVRCVVYGVAERWGAQAITFDEPRRDALDAATAWLAERAGASMVTTRARYAGHPALAGRVPGAELPALVLAEDQVSGERDTAGLEIGPAHDRAEYLSVFGAELAPLVTEADLADPYRTYLVGRREGVPVAIAMVRRTGDAAQVGAVAVLPDHGGRGYGTAISAAATRTAIRSGVKLVWLHSTPASERIYARLGYRVVDRHLQLV